MTHPTRAIYKWLLSDYVKISSLGEDSLYDEQDLQRSYDKIEVVDFHQEVEVGSGLYRCELGNFRYELGNYRY